MGIRKIGRTILKRIVKKSDYGRWKTNKNLQKSWDARTKIIAGLIHEGASVLEFGCGRMVLKSLLPVNCTYLPSDISYRGEGTLVCDLNKMPLPDFGFYDVIVFSGVLEYIFDIDKLFGHIKNNCQFIIASYAFKRTNQNISWRRKQGWVNDYTLESIQTIFLKNGFYILKTIKWNSQLIFVLSK
jgi:hypothetical protein